MSSRRPARRAATLLAALVAAPLAIWAAPAGTASGSAGGPTLTLDAQSEWVAATAADPTFGLVLNVTDPPATASVELVLYGHLLSRSSLHVDAKTGPQGTPLTTGTPVPLSSLPPDKDLAGAVDLDVPVVNTPTELPTRGPYVDLQCGHPTGFTCTGVFPVSVVLSGAHGAPVRSLTTFLTYVRGTSTHRLRFGLVVPVSTPVHQARTAAAALRTAPLPPAQAKSLETLITQVHEASGVPLTLEASPRTMAALRQSGAGGEDAVRTLAVMSQNQAVDEIPAQPYVPVDLQTLAAAGEPTEIHAQMAAGATTLDGLQIHTEKPRTSVWLAAGAGSDLFGALGKLGEREVVLPAADLATATQRTNRTPAATFAVDDKAAGTTLSAARADSAISSELSDPGSDPALAASVLLADLAFIHFEAPNDPTVRGVVGLPSDKWRPTATFDETLLAGLADNPVVQPLTLMEFFATVHPTGPPLRLKTDAASGSPTLDKAARVHLSTARTELSAFDSAVTAQHPPAVIGQLDRVLLCSEASPVATKGSADSAILRGVRLFQQALDSQTEQVAFAGEQTVTLTAQTGVIPVTVVRQLHYVVTGVLQVSSGKFTFPGKSTQTIRLDHNSNPGRIDVKARSPGEATLTVTFSTPTRHLVIAKTTLQVRSTATSLVGIVLTAVALAVLLLWWARTGWTGRRRRGAPVHDAATAGA